MRTGVDLQREVELMTASSRLSSEETMKHGVGGGIWRLREGSEDGKRVIFDGLGLNLVIEVDVCLAGTLEVGSCLGLRG
jgi:hypothetical protein